MSPAFGYRSWIRLAFIEWACPPLTLTVHGNWAVSGQSGMHWPLAPRESPLPDLPHSTTRVLTGVTIGICWVRTAGTTLVSGVVEKSVTPGTSTLGTEPTTRNCRSGPTTGSLGSPAKACASDSVD